MRIHFVSLFGRSPWGGCEELWAQTALRMQQDGDTVSAGVKWWPEQKRHPLIRSLCSSGAKVSFWGRPGTFYWSLVTQALNRMANKARVRKRLQAARYPIEDAELVVFSSGGNDFPIEPIRRCREKGTPYILVIHSVSESSWPRDDELETRHYVYDGAEAAFFVSHANRASTALQLGFDSPKFHVVINPFNVSRDVPRTWPQPAATHQWAFVGRLEPGHKGVDLLLRALARERWAGRNLQLNFYGNGVSERSVRRMAEMLNLGSRAVFHGQVSDVESIWKTNELLVLPSRHEGLPLVVIEAMLCGRPCLVTNVSGNPEHVEEGVTGFLAAGPTVDAVDAALETAWARKAEFRQMGETAYTRIRSRIPQDPIGIFAQRLRGFAAKCHTAPELVRA